MLYVVMICFYQAFYMESVILMVAWHWDSGSRSARTIRLKNIIEQDVVDLHYYLQLDEILKSRYHLRWMNKSLQEVFHQLCLGAVQKKAYSASIILAAGAKLI